MRDQGVRPPHLVAERVDAPICSSEGPLCQVKSLARAVIGNSATIAALDRVNSPGGRLAPQASGGLTLRVGIPTMLV